MIIVQPYKRCKGRGAHATEDSSSVAKCECIYPIYETSAQPNLKSRPHSTPLLTHDAAAIISYHTSICTSDDVTRSGGRVQNWPITMPIIPNLYLLRRPLLAI